MPTYVYETVEPHPIRFEIKQCMSDDPLTHHPETGVPVRRVISGGYGYMPKNPAPAPNRGGGHHCCNGCPCAGH